MSSRSRANESAAAVDIWSKLQRDKLAQASNTTTVAAASAEGETETTSAATAPQGAFLSEAATEHSHIIFLGDASSGKSSLIQTFLKPNAAKETKPTVALDYNYARKTANNGKKFLANFWEAGGDLTEPQLLEIPLAKQTLLGTTFVVVVDLSKPHNAVVSVLRALSAIREVITQRIAELQATDVHRVKELRDKVMESYLAHPDANRVKPTDVPIVIVANKHDCLRTLPLIEKKALFQALRFIAHYFGAALLTMSSTTQSESAAMRDTFRNLLHAIAFSSAGSMPTAKYKPSCETDVEKGVFISRAQDSFENILLNAGFGEDADTGKVKYRLVSSPNEVGAFITEKGVKKDVWGRLVAHMGNIFGDADPLPSMALSEEKKEMESGADEHTQQENANPFPETDVDDMRTVRDASLRRYMQEAERKQDMLHKLQTRGGAF